MGKNSTNKSIRWKKKIKSNHGSQKIVKVRNFETQAYDWQSRSDQYSICTIGQDYGALVKFNQFDLNGPVQLDLT